MKLVAYMQFRVNVLGMHPELLCVWSGLDADGLEKFDHSLAHRLGWFIAAFAANELAGYEARGEMAIVPLSERSRLRSDLPGAVRIVGVAYIQDNHESDGAFDVAMEVRERFIRARDTLEAMLPAIVAGGNQLIGVGIDHADKPIPFDLAYGGRPNGFAVMANPTKVALDVALDELRHERTVVVGLKAHVDRLTAERDQMAHELSKTRFDCMEALDRAAAEVAAVAAQNRGGK